MLLSSFSTHRCKHNRILFRLTTLLCCLLWLAASMPVSLAAGTQPQLNVLGSVTIQYGEDDVALSGAEFSLFRIANLTESLRFQAIDPFDDYQNRLNGNLKDNTWQELALTLASVAASESVTPITTDTTDAEGHAVLTGLPTGLYLLVGKAKRIDDVVYTPEPSLVTIPSYQTDGTWLYDVIVHPKYEMETEPTIDLQVQKVWKDQSSSQRPQSITVQLYRDGNLYDTVVLNRAGNWRFTWYDLDSKSSWTVKEVGGLNGYEPPLITRHSYTYIITNERTPVVTPTPTLTPPPGGTTPTPSPTPTPYNPEIPQTGLLWWPVPVLAAAGMLLFVLGWIKQRQDDAQ